MLSSKVAKLFQCAYSKWFSNKNSDMMSKLDKKTEKFWTRAGVGKFQVVEKSEVA